MWEDLTLTRLREIARHYNKKVKIAGIAKLKKEEVIAELKKHLDLSADNKSVKHRTDKSDIMLLEKGEPKITAEYKATGKGKEYKKGTPKATPKKAVKDELADLERKSADKKRIKAQAEGAKADKEAIKPPSVAEATDFVIKKKKATLPPRKEKMMTEEEAKAELKKLQDEAKKKKVVGQAQGASEDAKAIKPPEEEPKKEEEPKAEGERSEKNMIKNIVNSQKTKLRKRITEISEEVGVKLPRGVLTKNMYSEELRKGSNSQFGTSNKGQNTGREDLSTNEMLKVALSYMGDKKTEFLTKLFKLIYEK
jgi:hypothetical protein